MRERVACYCARITARVGSETAGDDNLRRNSKGKPLYFHGRYMIEHAPLAIRVTVYFRIETCWVACASARDTDLYKDPRSLHFSCVCLNYSFNHWAGFYGRVPGLLTRRWHNENVIRVNENPLYLTRDIDFARIPLPVSLSVFRTRFRKRSIKPVAFILLYSCRHYRRHTSMI